MPDPTDPDQPTPNEVSSPGAGGMWQPPPVEEAAQLFPQYEVIALIGRGGMGAVYQARQVALDRLVAIKLLPLEVSADRDFADRFVREARTMGRLSHPNIIAVYDFGQTSEGHLYFAMEFVEGTNLHQMIHGPGLEATQTLSIIGEVCEALAYAHGKGVVHRDIKPANVMVNREGRVKVADFGLARLTDPSAEQLGRTQTGFVMGTPDYMAPEQKRGMNVDHRADIYSLGVMLYEMLCKETPQGVFDPPSHRVPVDPRIDQVVVKAMQQTPDRRFQSSTEMKAAVDMIRTMPAPRPQGGTAGSASRLPVAGAASEPAQSRTLLYAGIAAAVVLVGIAALALAGKTKPKRSTAIATPIARATPVLEQATPAPVVKAEPTPVPATPMAVAAATPPPATPAPPTPAPAPATASGPKQMFNLMGALDLTRDRMKAGTLTKANDWTLADGKLTYTSDGGSGKITVPVNLAGAREYSFELSFRPLGTASVFTIDLPVSPKLQSGLDFHPGTKVELGLKDGMRQKIGDWPSGQDKGGRVLVLVKFVGTGSDGSVTVWLDDQQIAQWSGALAEMGKPLEYHPDFPGQQMPSLFCFRDSYEFTNWTLRVFEGEAGKPLRPAIAAPAPVPEVKAAPEVVKWLADQDATYTAQWKDLAVAPFESALTKLREQYVATIDRAITEATKSAKLEDAIAWRNEQARLAAQQPHEAEDVAGDPSALKQLRAWWRTQFAKLDADRFARAKVVHQHFDALLARGQEGYTQKQRFEDALLLKNKREEIAKLWLAAPLDFARSATPKPTMGQTLAPPKPVGAGTGTLSGRDAVEWFAQMNGDIVFHDATGAQQSISTRVDPNAQLPKGKLDAVSASFFAQKRDGTNITDADFEKVAPLRKLTTFQLNAGDVTGTGLGFLAGCPDLADVSLNALATTDAALVPLLGLRKLTRLEVGGKEPLAWSRVSELASLPSLAYLTLSNAHNFPPAAFARARKLRGITINSTKLTEEQFAAIASLPELNMFVLTNQSDAGSGGLKHLQGAKALVSLNLTVCSGTGEQLAFIGKLRNLAVLYIDGHAVPGLAAAAGAPALRTINVAGFTGSQGLTDEGLKVMAGSFPRLEALTFMDGAERAVTADGIRSLAKLSKLKAFSWGRKPLPHDIASALAALPALETLTLADSAIDETHLNELAKSKSLAVLDLSSQKLTPAAFDALKTMRGLRELNLALCGLSDGELGVLRKALPKCSVKQ